MTIINKDWLVKHSACSNGREWVIATYPDGVDYQELYFKLLDYNRSWAIWLMAKGAIADIKHLLASGADANAKDDNGSTALIWAAWNGYDKVAKLLLKHGADVNAKNDNGYTALIWAARYGYDKVAKLLKSKGAA